MIMRIVEWNCQGSFRTKNQFISPYGADIMVILECENSERLKFNKLTPEPNDFVWHGDSPNKGIGIFSYSDYRFEILKDFNPLHRYIVPIRLFNENCSFLLIAVWAMDHKTDPLSRYIGQIWNAMNYYSYLLNENILVIGDFNSNQIWDGKERTGNHSALIELLQNNNISSLYHRQFNEGQGKESRKTFFMHRNPNKGYHIDYILASDKLIESGYNLALGDFGEWKSWSDHIPLILDINEVKSNFEYNALFSRIVERQTSTLSTSIQSKFSAEIQKLKDYALALDNGEDKAISFHQISDTIEKLKKIDNIINSLLIYGEKL